MDEATRRLERAARRGEPQAHLRHARHLLRSDEPAAALAQVADAPGPQAAAVRAAALLRLDRVDEAADAAGAAVAEAPGGVEADTLEALARALLDRPRPADPLAQLLRLRRAAGLGDVAAPLLRPLLGDADPLARAQLARVPALAVALADDPAPLVRHVAAGAPPTPPFPREPVPTRLFSAWGRDWDLGRFVACRCSMEGHLRLFDWALLEAIDRLLGPGERVVAMGLGYGLAVPSGAAVGDLEARVAALEAAEVLPFALQLSSGQPFDRLDELEAEAPGPLSLPDERLAHRFAHDLTRHPARLPNAPEPQQVFARFLRHFGPGAPAPAEADLEPLRAEARTTYGAVGLRALELFEGKAAAERGRRGAHRRPGLA